MSKSQIETAKVIILSTAHLHPKTAEMLRLYDGDLPGLPDSIFTREYGVMLNSLRHTPDALDKAFTRGKYPAPATLYPDLILLQAFGRGERAEWICLDADGDTHAEILPVYDHDHGGILSLPNEAGWAESLSNASRALHGEGHEIVIPSRFTLEQIEAGQTPHLSPEQSL